jgi:hypothetical protein
MAIGFTIAEVRFRGEEIADAVVRFAPGLSVVAGPSNTGKSLIRSAINFAFGSSDPMKGVQEAASFRTILVEIRTSKGDPITFERAWNGGEIRQYEVHAKDVAANTPSIVLAAKHSADNDENISAVLLGLSGLAGIKLLKSKSTGTLRNLSFRDFIEYVLVSEERIITELSPVHSASYTDQTAESSLFRVLLTGKDDKDIVTPVAPKDQKAHFAGQELAVERMREDLKARLPQDGRAEEDFRRAAEAIDIRVAEQSRLLQSYRTDLVSLEQKRRTLLQDQQRTNARLTQIDGNLRRFQLLMEQYDSDLERLRSNLEAGSLMADFQEGPCPICGAAPQYHVEHGITQTQLDEFTEACRAEAEKIRTRQADLNGTVAELEQEQKTLQATVSAIEHDRQETANSLKAILEPSIANVDDGLSTLVAQRAEIAGAISLFEELTRLDQLAQQLEPPPPSPKGKKEKSFASLPPQQFVEFAKAVEQILKAWSFPELDGVAYDTTAEDIVISGKARKDNGKGYRAITYAAFVVAVLQETQRKNLSHPGFIVLDSPLVTYREPEEHMGEGVKNAFYRNLAATIAPAQVIVLENEDPPDNLQNQISFEVFTKNRNAGRYGLFPQLSVE